MKQRRRFLSRALIYPFRIFKLGKSDIRYSMAAVGIRAEVTAQWIMSLYTRESLSCLYKSNYPKKMSQAPTYVTLL